MYRYLCFPFERTEPQPLWKNHGPQIVSLLRSMNHDGKVKPKDLNKRILSKMKGLSSGNIDHALPNVSLTLVFVTHQSS